MQKNLLLMLLLTAALLTASSVDTGPTERQIPPWQHLWDGLTPVDQGQSTGNNNVINSNEPDRTRTDAGGTGTPRSLSENRA